MRSLHTTCFMLAAVFAAPMLTAQEKGIDGRVRSAVKGAVPSLLSLYHDLHRHPEISFQEEKTGEKLAARLRALGFEVETKIGGFGVVGVFRNGAGPTVMLRTDTDALPIKEETGLPFASVETTVDEDGKTVPTMHACGHDMHMTIWSGAAKVLVAMKDAWSGTLVLIGQPAEERGMGATAMIRDGLFKRFPRPDWVFALHVDSELPAGRIGYREGYGMANVDSVDILVKGRGGHGAYPHKALDPVVIAAHIVVQIQTIVSREVPPHEAAVVTVGSIHGGTKHNIIPNEVKLQLTVRSYGDEPRRKLIDSIKRVARHVAQAQGAPDDLLPDVTMNDQFTPSTYNTPALVTPTVAAFRRVFGESAVTRLEPKTWGEDFGQYGRVEPRIPIFMYFLGAQAPEVFEKSLRVGAPLPGLHSSRFAPDAIPTLTTGVRAMVTAVLEQLGNDAKDR